MPRSYQLVERFAPEAAALRAVFDDRLADPRSTRGDRFVWDYWHVPNQYTHLRTPAWTYFPRALYTAFHRRLVAWGRATLGCHDISPPWLSCYVDGCSQQLHGDLPHGPFAFVLSLTRTRAFSGGETLLLRDNVLDFWDDFTSVRAVEQPDLVHAIAPNFNRLVVFDPRIPHGVREVRGTRDPRAGRLVIHGWFVQPRPFIAGPLRTSALTARTNDLLADLPAILGDLPLAGLLSLALDVTRTGTIARARVLVDTTRVPRAYEPARRRAIARVVAATRAWRFGAQRGTSRITLPLVFERG